MKELEILLEKRWILKSEDKELYYKIRDSIGEIRKFATEKLGCQVLENSLLVKMEKIPAIPESFMGIEKFTAKEEYAYLCVLLMFLEDKEAEEQFILSQLTEYVAANMPGGTVDWTSYINRRRLVKVLRYAVEQGILKITDGNTDSFMEEYVGEVLYENMGTSKYFMRNFPKDIMGYNKPEDFQESEWYAMQEDRGIVRRHRVYKRLLFAPAMYKMGGPLEDFDYLKNYGRRLAEDLEQNFDCQVHIHKGSAFFIAGEDCQMGKEFPGNNTISDIVLLCCAKIRQKVKDGVWKKQADETVRVNCEEFSRAIKEVKYTCGSGFSKNYREMTESDFVREVIDEMKAWTFIKEDKVEHQILIFPLAGKISGKYPKDFIGGAKDE